MPVPSALPRGRHSCGLAASQARAASAIPAHSSGHAHLRPGAPHGQQAPSGWPRPFQHWERFSKPGCRARAPRWKRGCRAAGRGVLHGPGDSLSESRPLAACRGADGTCAEPQAWAQAVTGQERGFLSCVPSWSTACLQQGRNLGLQARARNAGQGEKGRSSRARRLPMQAWTCVSPDPGAQSLQ